MTGDASSAEEPGTAQATDANNDSPTLMVLDKRLAALTGLVFVILIVVPLVVRKSLKHPPVAVEFFSNMVIAGVIIFGGPSTHI